MSQTHKDLVRDEKQARMFLTYAYIAFRSLTNPS